MVVVLNSEEGGVWQLPQLNGVGASFFFGAKKNLSARFERWCRRLAALQSSSCSLTISSISLSFQHKALEMFTLCTHVVLHSESACVSQNALESLQDKSGKKKQNKRCD